MDDRRIRPVPMRDMKPPQINFRLMGLLILGLLAVLAVTSMAYTVQPEEVGVVQTFGKYTKTTEPGFHLKLPRPIQTVIKVPQQRQLKQEFGFRTDQPGVRTQYSAADFVDETMMLTGDLNVAQVEWITQYRIVDPMLFLFRVRNAEATLRDMTEGVMRSVIGDRGVNEVLTVGRQEIATEVERRLQELCDQYQVGIKIEQIVLQDVTPPEEVKPSFNEVNQAQQERERLINQARAEFNRVIPRASGEAQQMIQEAEGYATDRVNRARGDAALFESVLAAYKRSPVVTRQRIYLETMQSVLPTIDRKIVMDDDLKGIIPLLSLDQAGVQR